MRSKKPKEEYSLISVRVKDFKATVGSGISSYARDKRHQHDELQVYEFGSTLELNGICLYPEDRSGSEVVITIYGDDPIKRDLDARLKDYHVRNNRDELQYRRTKSGYRPVYEPPQGIGYLHKTRGENSWNGVIWVTNQTVTQMLSLLNLNQGLYMGINEVKVSRNRWIRDFDLRTTDPAYE